METFYRNETNRKYPHRGSSKLIVHQLHDGQIISRPVKSNGTCVIGGLESNSLDNHGSSLENDAGRREAAYPWSLQQGRTHSLGRCVCQCACRSSARPKIQKTLKEVHNNASHLSSWRLLHISRAKLKGSAATSELLAGFATVAMVELNIHDPTVVPEWLFVVFTVTTSILVSVHIFALMISTHVLPNMDAIVKVHPKGSIAGAPHESMHQFIDIAWSFSNLLGLFLFLLDVAVICWIQLVDYSFIASLAGSIIMGPVLIAFMALVIHFHKKA